MVKFLRNIFLLFLLLQFKDFCILFHIIGTEWKLIEPPPGKHFVQISVGSNALWVVTKNKEIFFNTINSSSPWKSMVGEFDQITVGPNDQVNRIK